MSDQEQQRLPIQQAMPNGSGLPTVDETVAGLAEIGELPAKEQVAAFAEVHRALQETLAMIDER